MFSVGAVKEKKGVTRGPLVVYCSLSVETIFLIEPRHEKTCSRGFRPDLTQTGLHNHSRWLESCNFELRKKRDCTFCKTETKALIGYRAADLHFFRIFIKLVFS